MVIFDDRWDMRLASAVSHLFDCTWSDSSPFAVLGVEVDVCQWDRLKHSATRRTNVRFFFFLAEQQHSLVGKTMTQPLRMTLVWWPIFV
jgi:hypothetical protein